jgi:glucan 1,4-alpha-glucosidase
MLIKRIFVLLIITVFVSFAYADQLITVQSPDGNIRSGFHLLDNGNLQYQVSYKGKTVIAPSGLGFTLKVPEISLLQFNLLSVDSSSFDETWKPVWGEQSLIRNNYRQLILRLIDKSGSGIKLSLVARVFNDGMGFRYEFPQQEKLNHFVITDELTQFTNRRS